MTEKKLATLRVITQFWKGKSDYFSDGHNNQYTCKNVET